MDDASSNGLGTTEAINIVSSVVYVTLFVVVATACARQLISQSLQTHKTFHLMIGVFVVTRLVSTFLLYFENKGDMLGVFSFFVSRTAIMSFSFSSVLVTIFLLDEIIGVSEKTVRRLWIFFWLTFALSEIFLISVSIYFIIDPSSLTESNDFFEISILLGNFVSLFALIGMVIAGVQTLMERNTPLRESFMIPESATAHRQLYHQHFRHAFLGMAVFSLVTAVFLLIRLAFFVFVTVLGYEHALPLWVFYFFAYWAPELVLTLMFLYVMRGIPKEGSTRSRISLHSAGRFSENDTLVRVTNTEEDQEKPLVEEEDKMRENEQKSSVLFYGTGGQIIKDQYEQLQERLRRCMSGGETSDSDAETGDQNTVPKRTPDFSFFGSSSKKNTKSRNMRHVSISKLAPYHKTREGEPVFVGQAELSVSIKTKGKIKPVVALYSSHPAKTFSGFGSIDRIVYGHSFDGAGRESIRRAIFTCQQTGANDLKYVRNLVENEGVDPTTRDNEGLSGLHVGAMVGSLELIHFLLDVIGEGGSVLSTEKDVLSLHYFCARLFLDVSDDKVLAVLRRLVCFWRFGSVVGSLVNVRTSKGETPLHFACQRGDNTVVRFLLSEGADLTAVTSLGHTPKAVAKFNGLSTIASLLEKEEKKSRDVAPVPDEIEKERGIGQRKTNQCVDPVYVASYIERKDRDRTEVILKPTNETNFMRTLLARGIRGDSSLYLALYHILEEPDNLDYAKLIGTAKFSINALMENPPDEGRVTLALSSPTDKKPSCTNFITVTLEQIESYRHLPSGISRGYIFPREESQFLRVREELFEGLHSFALPALLLSLVSEERERQCAAVWEIMERFSISSGVSIDHIVDADLKSLRSGNDVIEKLKQIFHSHLNHYKHLLSSISLYSTYDKTYENLTFKPSTKKKDETLAFVPTNLHQQCMNVFERKRENKMGNRERLKSEERLTSYLEEKREEEEEENERVGERRGGREREEEEKEEKGKELGKYLVTSFGAPAAHVLKFKGGGLESLEHQAELKLHELLNKQRTLLPKTKSEKRKLSLLRMSVDALALRLQLLRRRDICYCQILPAVATSFRHALDLHKASMDVLEQYLHLGFLCEFESLLSTYKSEMGMLEDYEVSIRKFVSRIRFRIVLEKGPADSLLATEWMDEREKKPVRGENLPVSISSLFSSSTWDFGSVEKLFSSLYDTHHLVVTLPVDKDLFLCVGDKLGDRLIKVEPLFFTQGINEQQTFAIQLGNTSYQEKINRQNGEKLVAYFNKFVAHKRASGKSLDSEFERKIEGMMCCLLREIQTTKREKNVHILSLSADITRMMNGARLTSCKSAKDRTSMSITWEQARILSDCHQMKKDIFFDAMSVMRSAGVRRENAYKNIGKNSFAFNTFQLKLIPDIYRVPQGSGGASVT